MTQDLAKYKVAQRMRVERTTTLLAVGAIVGLFYAVHHLLWLYASDGPLSFESLIFVAPKALLLICAFSIYFSRRIASYLLAVAASSSIVSSVIELRALPFEPSYTAIYHGIPFLFYALTIAHMLQSGQGHVEAEQVTQAR